MVDNTDNKKRIRKQLLETRRKLSEQERAMQSLQLGAQVAAFVDSRNLPDKLTVAVYSAMAEEIDPAGITALFYSMGATVTFPCVFPGSEMEFYPLTAQEIDSNPPVFLNAPGRFIDHSEVADLIPIDPKALDLIIVPGVGFDKQRNRMGYGAGCYDRYIPRIADKTLLIGVCFDCQLVDELPTEPTDRKMDVIITPTVAF